MKNTATAPKKKKKQKRSLIPITDQDRKLLEELALNLGNWAEVSRALGFRGASTARRWANVPGSTFKGRDYPQRIRRLHEKVFGESSSTRLTLVEQKLDKMSDMLTQIAASVA